MRTRSADCTEEWRAELSLKDDSKFFRKNGILGIGTVLSKSVCVKAMEGFSMSVGMRMEELNEWQERDQVEGLTYPLVT